MHHELALFAARRRGVDGSPKTIILEHLNALWPGSSSIRVPHWITYGFFRTFRIAAG
jgi:hypothetical protein